MSRDKLSDDVSLGYGYLLEPANVDALVQQHNEHADALDTLEAATSGGNLITGTSFQWIEHWMHGRAMAQGNGWDSIPVGDYSLTFVGANSSFTPITGTGRLGVIGLDTGTTTTGYAALSGAATVSNANGDIDLHGFEAVVGFETLSSGSEEYLSTIGLVGNAPGYGVYFEYDRGDVNGANPTNAHKFTAVTMQGGVATRTLITGVTIAATSWPDAHVYKLRCEMDYTEGEARFYISDNLVHTETLTLPTHSLAGSVDILKSAGTTSRRIYLDYTRHWVELVAPLENNE